MDDGSSTQSHEERGAEKMMDDYLKSLDLHRKKIAKDGSCLFRAVAEQVTVHMNLQGHWHKFEMLLDWTPAGYVRGQCWCTLASVP